MLRINWVSAALASSLLWGFIIWVLVDETGSSSEVTRWTGWITSNFTWLYIVTQDVWFIFILYLLGTKYKDVKLGRDDEEPAFDYYEWFSMMFACGIGVGLYTFSVMEPISYYRGAVSKLPIVNDDQRAQQAITLTLFHWGLHGWIPYVLVAMTLGVVCYRHGRPMTIRSAFYPLFGENINGLFGDAIDALSIATTTFGVCTSLGLGVTTIASTMNRLNSDVDPNDDATKILIIWLITAVACTSVILGLKNGIRRLSKITFSIGLILLFGIIVADNPWFLLNSFVQSMGHYVQWVTQLGWDTDTWPASEAIMRDTGAWHYLAWGAKGESGAIARTLSTRGATNLTDTELNTMWGVRTDDGFMNSWTIFYWGWWISWAPFVGMFIARISRGRTVGEVIKGAFIAPILFGFFYLTVLGSLGIKMERIAELALTTAPADVDWRSGDVKCTTLGYAADGTPTTAGSIQLAKEGYYALSCRPTSSHILDIVEPYGKLSTLFQAMILIAIILYFITSSDSGSYVDDLISAMGYENPPVLQKVYWACTEGALAQALVTSGGLKVVQGVSIVCGLPFTFALNFMVVSLWRALKDEFNDEAQQKTRKGFNTCMLDVLEGYEPETAGANAPERKTRVVAALKNFIYPFDAIRKAKIAVGTDEKFASINAAVVTGVLWTAIGLLASTKAGAGAHSVAWLFYLILIFCIANIRREVRASRNILGNIMEDYTAAALYPLALAQMEHEAESDPKLA
jgi:choline-glycine betaine transporter